MPRLSLAFLGPLQITLDGQPLRSAAYDKVWALLAYLALAPGRAHSRDSLTALLWPEQPEDAARTNLRQALARLRQAIGDARAQPPFLLIERETLTFNPASDFQMDVAEFTALAAACDTHRHRHRETCLPCAQRQARAEALYRGRFLEQFFLPDSAAFEEWALVTRELLHQRALAGLAQLADYHERRGDLEPARRYVARVLALDPWREEAHRQMMRLLVLSGQRSAALVQYVRCRDALAAELGVEPAEETTRYYNRIRAGEFDEHAAAEGQAAERHPLPPQVTPFVGRARELAALGDLLADPACRLVTLAGPGGMGKTRLALQAAAEQGPVFAQGAAFVPLAPLSSAEFIVPAIAAALGLSLAGDAPPAAQLLRYLSQRELLLVLDNFEHLPAGAALLLDILRGTPAVTLLVTSREPLKLRAEWVFDVAGLPAPPADDTDALEGFDAVALFVQRARQAQNRFDLAGADAPAVAHICRLLAGMPLGIELAAAWVRTLTCAEIARAIQQDLDVLTSAYRDAPDRHQSLRAVFNHSWALLAADEQVVLRQLAVFRGGFTSEAAAAIAGVAAEVAGATPAHLQALVDKSLLRRGADERYELHELVRQYAAEQLAAVDEADDTAARHLAYHLALAQSMQLEGTGPRARHSFERLAQETDNWRAALEWCRRRSQFSAWQRLAAALWFHWEATGALAEGLYWLEEGLAQPDAAPDAGRPGDGTSLAAAQAARAQALIAACALRRRCGDYLESEVHGRRALELCLRSGDARGIAGALHHLGRALRDQGRLDEAVPLIEDSLRRWRALGDDEWAAMVLGTLAIHYSRLGQQAQAQKFAEESLALCRALGNIWTGAFQLQTLGNLADRQGRFAQARVYLEESLQLFQDVGFKPGLANSLEQLGHVLQEQGDWDAARARYETSLGLRRLMGGARDNTRLLAALEEVAMAQADHAAARDFAAERQRWLAAEAASGQAATAPMPHISPP